MGWTQVQDKPVISGRLPSRKVARPSNAERIISSRSSLDQPGCVGADERSEARSTAAPQASGLQVGRGRSPAPRRPPSRAVGRAGPEEATQVGVGDNERASKTGGGEGWGRKASMQGAQGPVGALQAGGSREGFQAPRKGEAGPPSVAATGIWGHRRFQAGREFAGDVSWSVPGALDTC